MVGLVCSLSIHGFHLLQVMTEWAVVPLATPLGSSRPTAALRLFGCDASPPTRPNTPHISTTTHRPTVSLMGSCQGLQPALLLTSTSPP